MISAKAAGTNLNNKRLSCVRQSAVQPLELKGAEFQRMPVINENSCQQHHGRSLLEQLASPLIRGGGPVQQGLL